MTYNYDYPRPSVTVDGLVFRIVDDGIEILLIQRKKEPFKDLWAFPGGFMEIDETPEAGVLREVQEETGISLDRVMQLGAFGEIHRDPRGRTVSIAYIAFVKSEALTKAADDAADVKWVNLKALHKGSLAFDHDVILQESIGLLKGETIKEKLKKTLELEEEEIGKIRDFCVEV
jgi:8-oxo-dGTP diphosphatase